MSFIKKYLQPVEDIIESIESNPKLMQLLDEFITAYQEDDSQDFSKITSKYKN